MNSTYSVLVGGEFQLFAEAAITDSSSSSLTLTVSLSQTAAGGLVDPNAGADGGSYNSGTGVYTVSGTPAQVTAALRGLQFVPAAGSQGVYETLTVSVTDGLANSTLSGTVAKIYAAQSYAGGGQTLTAAGQASGFLLSNTGGVPDTIAATNPGDYAIAVLDDAQASFDLPAIVWLAGSGDSASFSGNSGGWDAAYGDDGVYTLAGASLAVSGDDAYVILQGAGDQVSFNAPTNEVYHEIVDSDDGTVIAVHSDVALTGDNDVIYLDNSGDILDLYGVTSGAWSTLYASSGFVNLHGASLSIFGGGVAVDAIRGEGDDAVSLYQTDGVADTVTGDDMTVVLTDSQAVVSGTADTIWFVGGSDSTVTVDAAMNQPDWVYGAGTIDVVSGEVASVGGGALVNFEAPGELAYLSYTQGVWDRVQGAAGTTDLLEAQAVVYGGNQAVDSLGSFNSDDDTVTLARTNGDWDSAYGVGKTLNVDGAQANVFGVFRNIYISGSDAAISLYGDAGAVDAIWGSNSTIIANGHAENAISGGGDKIYVAASASPLLTLLGANGNWDTVFGAATGLVLESAQASVFGGGNEIYAYDTGDAVSLYDTGGVDDLVYEGGAAVTFNNVSATLSGSDYYAYFSGGTNVASLVSQADDILTFAGAFGQDTIIGFNATDTIQLSASQFANFQAFENAFTQQGDDAVLTLDANDKVTFVGVQASSVTAAQVKFV